MDFPVVWQQLQSRAWMWTFGRHAVEEGVKMAKKGRIRIRTVELLSPRELEITAYVTDTNLTAYETTLTLQQNAEARLNILSRCLCPVNTYCKHAAALILYTGDRQQQELIEDKATTPEQPTEAESKVREEQADKKPALPIIQHSGLSPKPVLRLRRIDASMPGKDSRAVKRLRLPVADPMVTYEGCPERLSITLPYSTHEWITPEAEHHLKRDPDAERALFKEIRQCDLLTFMEAHPGVTTTAPLNHLAVTTGYEVEFWKNFREQEVPRLQERGWEVEISADFGFDIIELRDDQWLANLQRESGNGLIYTLEMGIEVDGRKVSLIPILAEAVQQGLSVKDVAENPDVRFTFLVPELGDRLLALPAARLLPILSILHELGSSGTKKKTVLKLDRLRAAQMGQQQGMALQMPAEIATLAQKLESFAEIPEVTLPTQLRATLRPYQHAGVNWLQFLREYGLHGILADDMGLGKTVQTIAHVLTEVEAGRADRPSLIIAPTSLLHNWAAEAKKFAPSLRVLILHGDHRRERYAYIKQCQLVITSYPLLIRDIEKLQRYEWHLVVLDEAHGIKNARAKGAQAARALNARHRLCLTGTPMENHLGELWSLFHFLMPGYLGEQDMFRTLFRNPIEKKDDQNARQRLHARLQPLLLRRTKDTVAKDLPPKTEILNTIELEKPQADLYETIRAAVDRRVQEAIADQGLEKSQLIVLDALLKLRQVCCHPRLIKAEAAQDIKASAKTMFLLDELLPELLEENRRVLVFSQFTEMLSLLEAELKQRNIRYTILTGSTKDRQKPVNEFQNGNVPLFLISLKAGGTGLNLTAADTVIHYDPWWNPAAEAQATDRAHRIGQTKPVFVHKLICQGTIEERIVEMQKRKSALAAGLLEGRTEHLSFSREDVKELLAPL